MSLIHSDCHLFSLGGRVLLLSLSYLFTSDYLACGLPTNLLPYRFGKAPIWSRQY